jgi:hypothetical protein
MKDRPPFDPLRHVFWLVAFVIGLYGFVIMVTAGVCLWHSTAFLPTPTETTRPRCDQDNRLGELLAAALAAALAFAGGFIRQRVARDEHDDDDKPKGE